MTASELNDVPVVADEPALSPIRDHHSPVTWTELEQMVRERWGGRRRSRSGVFRSYMIPSPDGGWLTLEIALRPRWCSLGVDRWHTSDRVKDPSQRWFEENIWPAVRRACEQKRGWGCLPGGGGAYAGAWPIDRRDLWRLARAWVDAELTWGSSAGEADVN